MNPTASAPMATARSASDSFVIPQIFTNTTGTYRTATSIRCRPSTALCGGLTIGVLISEP